MPVIKSGRKPRLTNAELALAMELRSEGVTWKIIAYNMGVRADTLHKRVKKAQADGMHKTKKSNHPVGILPLPTSIGQQQ